MTLTRQHFELIASLIRERGDCFKSNAAHARFAADTATELARTNPNFNRGTFMTACMPRWQVGTRQANVWERAY